MKIIQIRGCKNGIENFHLFLYSSLQGFEKLADLVDDNKFNFWHYDYITLQ